MKLVIYKKNYGLLVAMTFFIGSAQAQLSQNLTIGNPKAMALGNAITADSSGIDAVHYNPAALTKLKGRQVAVKFVTGLLDIRSEFKAPENYGDSFFGLSDDPVANRSGRTTTPAMYFPGLGGARDVPVIFAPLAGISISPPGSKFTFANNVYAPQALGFSRDDNDPGRYQGKQVVMQRITYLSPSVAYQVNDDLSVGLSIGFSHQALSLNEDFRAPGVLTGFTGAAQDALCTIEGNPFEVLLNICGGDLGPFTDVANIKLDLQQSLSPTWNIGFLWEPVDWFALGAVYQSEAKMKLKGDYNISYSDDWQGFWQGLDSSLIGAIFSSITPDGVFDNERGKVSLDLTYPAHFSTGIKLKPTPKWQINFDVKWTDYAAWNEFEIKFDRELDILAIASLLSPDNATSRSLILDRGYKSVWSWALGVQYQFNDRLSLRAGYEPRPSAIPGNKADILVPIGDATLYGLGAGYQWDKDTVIDFGFNYLVSKQNIPAGSSCSINCSRIDGLVYNPYADLDVKSTVKAYVFALTYRTTF
ncbi:outer membrane protein transport protein [Pseudomonas segetis]|uniref:Long-chain fatty acid transport protein n=1 Tax=Pseudomonas segetis TaxID=298908 RepID=A0A239AFR6_9PSED|nr:Long-chain fatty acid transport protein [Pseudomonas segetis]